MASEAAERLKLNDPQVCGPLGKLHHDEFGVWTEIVQEREAKLAVIPTSTLEMTRKIGVVLKSGIPPKWRRKWWFIASGGLELFQDVGDVWLGASETAKQYAKSDAMYFGGLERILDLIPNEMADEVRELLHTFWCFNRDIEFCPFILPIAVFLLVYMEKRMAYLALQAMVNKSKGGGMDSFMTLTRDHLIIANEVTVNLLWSKRKKVLQNAKKLGISISHVTMTMLVTMFVPFLCAHVCSSFLDMFFVTGLETPLRLVLFTFKQNKKEMERVGTTLKFFSLLSDSVIQLGDIGSVRKMLTAVHGMKIGRSCTIRRAVSAALASLKKKKTKIPPSQIGSSCALVEVIRSDPSLRQCIDARDEEDVGNSISTVIDAIAVGATGSRHSCSLVNNMVTRMSPVIHGGTLLTTQLLYQLRGSIPTRYMNYQAELVYTLSDDGALLETLCEKTYITRPPFVLLIKTAMGTYGAFLTHRLTPCPRPYGDTHTFVFNTEPYVSYLRVPPANNMFISVIAKDSISIGGPAPAILLDPYLSRIITAECPTFGSPPLFAGDSQNILLVEVYSLHY